MLVAGGVVLAAAGDVLEDEFWVQVYDGGVGTDYMAGVAIDSAGNVVGAECVAATPGSDGALVRFLRNGTVDWVEVLDNPASDAAPSASGDTYTAVCVDPDDNVIAAGSWSGDYYGGDYFHNTALVRKYTPAGALAWEWKGDRSYEAWASARAVTTDAAGNVYAAGSAFLSWGSSLNDWAVWKFNPDGQLESGFPIFYNYSSLLSIQDIAFGIAVHTDGTFVVVGVRGQADNAGDTKRDLDWHVRKYNADRSLAWEDTYNGPALLYDYPRSVVLDASGDVYVAGYTNVGTDNATGVDWDGLVIKYAKDTGARLWTRTAANGAGAPRHQPYYAMTIGRGGRLLLARADTVIGATLTEAVLDLRDPSDGSMLAEETISPGVTAVPYTVAYRSGLIAVGGHQQGPTNLDSFTALFEAPNTAPVLAGPPTASTALAAIGETVRFHAEATDLDGDAFSLNWDFGDGATATGTDPDHVYAAAGDRHVVVTVSDGKAQGTGALDLIVGAPLVTPSVAAAVDFRRPGRDLLTIRARVALPAGFAPEGRELTIDAGGVARTFTLDKKGRAKTADGSVALTYLKKKSIWTLTVQLARGDYAASLEDEGLTSRTVKKESVTIKATVDISGEFRCAHLVCALYTAKEGKTGAVK
jgi:hypothetical protein